MLEPLLRIDEVAGTLAVSEKTVRRLIDAGELPACRIGKAVRVEPAALATWVRQGGGPERDEQRVL